jgi:hypothetical protein
MFDRLFMPALTFTLLVAGVAAFAGDFVGDPGMQAQVEQLERVVVSAPRELPATPVARADADAAATVIVR